MLYAKILYKLFCKISCFKSIIRHDKTYTFDVQQQSLAQNQHYEYFFLRQGTNQIILKALSYS